MCYCFRSLFKKLDNCIILAQNKARSLWYFLGKAEEYVLATDLDFFFNTTFY